MYETHDSVASPRLPLTRATLLNQACISDAALGNIHSIAPSGSSPIHFTMKFRRIVFL